MKMTENKTEIIRVRVSPDVYEILEMTAEANGMTLSKYIRLNLEFLCMSIKGEKLS